MNLEVTTQRVQILPKKERIEEVRLDQLLHHRGFFASREKARRAIMAGVVRVEGNLVDKPGTPVSPLVPLTVDIPREQYVSRGGRKLEHALDHFRLDPTGMTCLDVGASTGGFTDCLLQRGAKKVYALDVGRGQLDYQLRTDSRVVVMEKTNARFLGEEDLPEQCELVTLDLSFISLVKVVPAVLGHLQEGGWLLPLIKPQFEVGRGMVGKGGIVRDEEVRTRVIEERVNDLGQLGLTAVGVVDSIVKGVKGNREAFALFRRSA
jgi:23S rRNA (cytidine1920-2'-O)/16S rRNA (cytidine1409-2'-O)-methyltransferase